MNNDQRYRIDISTGTIIKVALVVFGLWFLYLVRDIIALFLIAVIIMAGIEPAVNWLQNRNVKRPISVLLIYIILFSLLGAAVSFLIPALIEQTKSFSEDFPRIMENLLGYFGDFRQFIEVQNLNFSNLNLLQNVNSSSIFSTTVGFFSGIFSFVVVFAMAFYMSVKENGMERFLQSIVPKGYKKYAVEAGGKVKHKIGRWVLGQLSLMIIIFFLDLAVLTALGIPYALILAMIGGLLEIIPYLGPTVATILATIIGFIISPLKGFLVLIIYILIQIAEGNIITPEVMKKAVGLNPLAVILALLVGAKVAGILGAILAIPIATVIGVFLNDLLVKKDIKEATKEVQ